MFCPLRIFIVEDEVLLQLQLEMFIEDAGHHVVGAAASSRDALSRALAVRPDLALVDVHLADGPTGVEVGRTLSEHGVPVVFMTANASRIPDDFSGALGLISKPYSQSGVEDALTFLMQALRHAQVDGIPPCLKLAPRLHPADFGEAPRP